MSECSPDIPVLPMLNLTITNEPPAPPTLSEKAERALREFEVIAAHPKVVEDPRCSHSATVTTNLIRAAVRDLKDKNL